MTRSSSVSFSSLLRQNRSFRARRPGSAFSARKRGEPDVWHERQLEVPNRFRGRVFAAELAAVTLISSASGYATAFGLDRLQLSPRSLAAIVGVSSCVPGVAWLLNREHG